MSPHVPAVEFMKTNLAKAQALTPEYQDKLERLERTIRDEIARDPAMGPVYELLRRQLQLPTGRAMQLYPRLASRRSRSGFGFGFKGTKRRD
jgi:hypothetical protein